MAQSDTSAIAFRCCSGKEYYVDLAENNAVPLTLPCTDGWLFLLILLASPAQSVQPKEPEAHDSKRAWFRHDSRDDVELRNEVAEIPHPKIDGHNVPRSRLHIVIKLRAVNSEGCRVRRDVGPARIVGKGLV